MAEGYDKFGFPKSWSIGFIKDRVKFQHTIQDWSESDLNYLEGTKFLLDGEIHKALSTFEKITPKNFRENYNMGKVFELTNNPRKSKYFFEKAKACSRKKYEMLKNITDNNRISFVIPFPLNLGGMKTQVELAKHVKSMGYRVEVIQLRGDDILHYSNSFDKVVSLNSDLDSIEKVLNFSRVVVVGSWVDYYRVLKSDKGLVIGYSGGEPTLNETKGFDDNFLSYISCIHSYLPINLTTCSKFIQRIFNQRFTRKGDYIPTIIDQNVFFPNKTSVKPKQLRILLVARDNIEDKGLQYAIPAIQNLIKCGYNIEIVWISPTYPEKFVDLDCEFYLSPNKEEIGEIYRTCHIMVFPSIIEGLGFPPLEAMASGVAVITTDNGGSGEYVKNNVNCLIANKRDINSVQQKIIALYNDESLRNKLIQNGFATALSYNKERTLQCVKDFILHNNALGICTELP